MRMIGILLLSLVVNCSWAKEEEGHASGHGEEAAAEQAGPVLEYIALDPPLVVNLQGQRRYLRADVQIMTEGQETVALVKTHQPAIRHALIMLFADRDPNTLAVVAEREKLRGEALAEIKRILDQYASSEGVKDVFFSSFLIQ